MHILILGNGFDIAHGIDSRYTDFLEYCKNNDKYKQYIYSNIWLNHFITRQTEMGDTWIDLETEIYDVIKHVYSQFRTYFNKYSKKKLNYLFTIPQYKSSFNLYNLSNNVRPIEFYDVLKKDGYMNGSYLAFYLENISDLINLLYLHLREFTKLFGQYLEERIGLLCNQPKYKLNINKECISLLSFNYTNTCEKLYKINFEHNNFGIKTQAVYIHGKIEKDGESNLVLGTHSFYNYLPNDKDEAIPTCFNVFKKHNQRHKYNTISSYQELLRELKYPKKMYTPVFHIIGHSLNRTDHNILRHILLAKEKSIINIYYYDEESQEKLITNITEIIGEEEVMAKVKLIKQDDTERGILISQEDAQLIQV